MWQHSPHAFEACSSVWGAYTVTGPLLGKLFREKGLKPLHLPLPRPQVLPSLQHCFSSALRRSNCIGVCMDAYCVPVWWRSPSGTPQCRERAFVHYFRRQQKLCFHSQKTSHFKKPWWPPVLTTPNGFCALRATGDAQSTATYFSVRALISVLLSS